MEPTPDESGRPRRGRDRRGRGLRGPGVLPHRPGQPFGRTRRERFDDLVLGIVTALDERWHEQLVSVTGQLEYAVEDIPQLPPDWSGDSVPLSSLVRGSRTAPTRLVVFRRPIEQRCDTPEDLEALVLMVVAEQLAELLSVPPEDIHPDLAD